VVILFLFSEGEVLFFDEIYWMLWLVEEMLYLVMEDFCVDVVVGKGLGVIVILFELLCFILVGVIICFGLFFVPLCDWFGFIGYLDFYSVEELDELLYCLVGLLVLF